MPPHTLSSLVPDQAMDVDVGNIKEYDGAPSGFSHHLPRVGQVTCNSFTYIISELSYF